MEMWSGIQLTATTSSGNLQQIYPPWAPTGAAMPATAGQTIRKTTGGTVGSVTAIPDGMDVGTLEIWDVDGAEGGADVSFLTTITNAQLVALEALGKAKLIFSADFETGIDRLPINGDSHFGFMRGLAARFIAGTGTCRLNLGVEGGFYLTTTAG